MKPEVLFVGVRGCEADILRLNLPTWTPLFPKIVLLSPEDDQFLGADIVFGKSGHTGGASITRMRRCITLAMEYPCAALGEPDVMLFGEIECEEGELVGSEVHPNFDPRFTAPHYLHAPWIATRDTWAAILPALDKVDELDFGDRKMAAACIMAGVRLRGVGFSRNTIDTPEYLAAAMQAVRNGALAVHGIKDKAVADSLRFVANGRD